MADTGLVYPGTVNNINQSGLTWTNITNAKVSDGAMATWTSSTSGAVSDYFQAIGFGFAIPLTATLDGIVMELNIGQSVGAVMQGEGLLLENNGGAGAGVDRWATPTPANISVVQGTQTWGSSSDMWSTGYTPADVNMADFGMSFYLRKVAGATSQTVSVDFVRLTIYYTPAGGGAQSSQTLMLMGCGN